MDTHLQFSAQRAAADEQANKMLSSITKAVENNREVWVLHKTSRLLSPECCSSSGLSFRRRPQCSQRNFRDWQIK